MTPETFRKTTAITTPSYITLPFDGTPPEAPEAPTITPELQEQIDAAVAAATEGLRSTNQALKDEKVSAKSELNSVLESLGGKEGIAALQSMKDRFQNDELGKLLVEGKHEDWFKAKVGPMQAEHASQISALQAEVDAERKRADDAVSGLQSKVLEVDVGLAAVKAKTEPTAGVVRDITRAAREEFSWSDEHRQLVRKEGDVVVFGKDGKTPQTIAEWLNTQQEVSTHWWGPSVGSKAKGGKNQLSDGTANPWSHGAWNVTAQHAFAKEHGMEQAKNVAAAAGSHIGATSAPPA